jgi:hypothetical protein
MFLIRRRSTTFRLALVGAIFAGIALALLMAVSPELHEFVHHDGDADGHQCLVTLMQTGGCDDTAPETLVVTAFLATLFGTVPIGESAWVESVFASGSVFEHAPPFVS